MQRTGRPHRVLQRVHLLQRQVPAVQRSHRYIDAGVLLLLEPRWTLLETVRGGGHFQNSETT